MITQPGTVNFWIDLKKNPKAFTPGANIKWISFKLGPETCEVISESENLIGVLNQGTEREFRIFSVIPPIDPTGEHMVTLTWGKEELNLYFDGKVLHTIILSEFL
jgi:hypothetical protein